MEFGLEANVGRKSSWADKRNADLKVWISELMKTSRENLKIKYVKAHQNEQFPRKDLSQDERMNSK